NTKTKNKTFLRRKNPLKFVASAYLPLVGPGALKPSERKPASRSAPGSLQAHPSMRICSNRQRDRAEARSGIRAKLARRLDLSVQWPGVPLCAVGSKRSKKVAAPVQTASGEVSPRQAKAISDLRVDRFRRVHVD